MKMKRVAGAIAPALALIFPGTGQVIAQTVTAPATQGVPGTPPVEAPAPAVPGTLPPVTTKMTTPNTAAPAAVTLTLQQVVNLAVNNNSSVVLAQQRLDKEKYQIDVVHAQARPQVSASIADTISSVKSFGGAGSASAATPSLPGGGAIPTITDSGGGTTSTFIGGGGGGTAPSNGTSTSTTSVTTPAASASGVTISPTVSGGGLSGAGGGTGTGTTTGSTTGTGTAGTGGASSFAMQSLPPIARQYETAMIGPSGTAVSAATPHALNPHAPTSTTTTNNTYNSGSSGSHNNYSARATATQYIDLFGLVPATLDVEKITTEFYQIDLRRIRNETALAAKDDFFAVLRDQAQIKVDQDQVNAAAANLHITAVRKIAGTAAEADVLTAEVTLSNDQQTEVTDQNTLNLAQANLNNLLGLPPSRQVVLTTPPLPPLNAVIDLEKSTQIALQQRPELEQAQNNITIAQKLIRLSGASLLPSLGISAGADYNGNTAPGSPSTQYTLTAQVNIPLYDGGYAHAEVQSAKVDLVTQETTQKQLQQNVILEVQEAYLNTVNDQVRAKSAEVSTANAVEAARIARLQYQYGTNTYLNVLNAQAQLATAETDELNAEFSYQTDLATLVRAIGGR